MKIVIVEDDIFFRNFYSSKLQSIGIQIALASDGEEGLTKIREILPDLIILDIIMPKKNGFEVLTALKSDPQLQNIPVLVFSTLGQESDVEKAKQMGAADYINKSYFDLPTLYSKIENLTHTKLTIPQDLPQATAQPTTTPAETPQK